MSKAPRTKKSLGQHFLHDGNIIRKIVASIPANTGDKLVEIGPGSGALTELLIQQFEDVTVIEVDSRMIEHLKERFNGIEIIHSDILDYDWTKLENTGKPVHVVGNLPYYITSQILFHLLQSRHLFESATLMIQKEVAERIVAGPGSKEYGILSVQVQLMSSPEILFDVSPHVFTPPPNVKSAVMRLRFDRPGLACSDDHLKSVVRTAFNQRRKKLSNALKPLDADLPVDEFDFDLRAEAWPPEEYEKLTARLEQLGHFS